MKGAAALSGMLYEDFVDSFPELVMRLRVLDQDAGVRLIGGSGRKRFLVFVTRFGRKYTVMTYTMEKKGAPGKRLQTLEFDDFGGLERALKGFAKGNFQAWIY